MARRESRLGPFIWQNRTTVTFFAASSYSFQSDFPLSNIGASSQPGSAPELLSISAVFLPAGIIRASRVGAELAQLLEEIL